jgi:3'-phosphoadenosine 5'-phosphosulfate sulfotransferase (PAPS reductase)/FAD synthetase
MNAIAYSGGKDSTALLCWAEDNLDSYFTVFCDTVWEFEDTYRYIHEIVDQLKRCYGFKILKSEKYPNGMRDLVRIKGRVPSAKARFCTENLKVEPMQKWVKAVDDEVILYQGIRRDESESRMKMQPREWSDIYDCWVERPLFYESAEQCFERIRAKGFRPNPLYLMGAGRVGCFPCVLINQRELKAYLSNPSISGQLQENIRELEELSKRSFFEPTYIPERFCTGYDPKSGKKFPWCQDVFDYVMNTDKDQLPLLPTRSCMSVYNLCE